MAERVVLHVGTMKSGTTYLQDVLSGGGLAGSGGWYVAGGFDAQNLAVRQVLGRDEQPRERWQALVDEAREGPGVAVVSHEFLSFVGRRRAHEVVAAFAPAPVEVVLTVRDQHRAVPAQWQSYVRNRGQEDWAGYQQRLLPLLDPDGGEEQDDRALRSFRRAQHVPGILRRWSSAPGVERVVCVAVPAPGAPPEALWRRFCEAARLEPGSAAEVARRSNESLGHASCEVLVHLNRACRDWDRERYAPVRDAAVEALLGLRRDEDVPRLDRDGLRLAAALNQAVVDAVHSLDVELVGSLADLVPPPSGPAPAGAVSPDPAHVARALEAVRHAVAPSAPAVTPAEEPAAVAHRLAGHLSPAGPR